MFFGKLIVANPWWTEFFLYAYTLFTIVLSVYVLGYHGKLKWWDENCDSASNEDKEKNKPDSFGFILAILFMVALGLMTIYSIYTFFSFGKVAGQTIEGPRANQLRQSGINLANQAKARLGQTRGN